jgi:ankyrin repeat protein
MHRDDEVIRCDELHLAAEAGDVERVRELIAQGHDVNAFDEIGHTPLHYAASGEYLGVAALLLQSGADVNAHDESLIGNTPLGEIAGNCSLKMAKLLVNAGADPIIPGWCN